MASKIEENLKQKTILEKKSTKHVEHVPNVMPLDLQETCFRMEWSQTITKTRGADKSQKQLTKCVKIQPQSMQNRSRSSTKNDALKQMPNKTQKVNIYWGKCLLEHLWSPKPLKFAIKKWAPSVPKVFPMMIEK